MKTWAVLKALKEANTSKNNDALYDALLTKAWELNMSSATHKEVAEAITIHATQPRTGRGIFKWGLGLGENGGLNTQRIVDNLLSQFYEGNQVEARSNDQERYYSGKITRAHSGGTYDITYEDKKTAAGIKPEDIRFRDKCDCGCMVLVRVAPSKNGDLGKRFAARIRKGRQAAGLDGKFAVLLDLSQHAASLAQCLRKDSPTLYNQLVSRKQPKYRDLVSFALRVCRYVL
jgi:hypothetical protein